VVVGVGVTLNVGEEGMWVAVILSNNVSVGYGVLLGTDVMDGFVLFLSSSGEIVIFI
jgi:hypothetical protein